MASPTTRSAPPSAPSESTFEDATDSFIDWFRLHSTKVVTGMAAVVVVAGGYMAYRAYSSGQAARAERAFFEAQAPLANRDLAGAERSLRQVATRYDGTAGGAQAQLALAQLLYDQGKYQDGLNALKGADDAPAALKPAVIVMRAAGEEGLGRPAEAAKLYEQAANDEKIEARKNDLLANAARAYTQAGQKDAARKIWSDLAQRQDNPLADEARVRLGELSAAPEAR
jgi:predicted negative regulator of RcsB-dependent stress response